MRSFGLGLLLSAFSLSISAQTVPVQAHAGSIPGPRESSPLFHEAVAGGTSVQIGDLFWRSTVYITVKYKNRDGIQSLDCTGAILETDFILTAAHCLPALDAEVKIHFFRGHDTLVATRLADEFRIHRNYRPDDEDMSPEEAKRLEQARRLSGAAREISYDLGLIRFKGGLPEGYERISFLPESRKNWLAPGAPVIGVGFGATNGETKQGGGTLRFAPLEVELWHNESEISVRDPNEKVNLCFGDSGGPGYVLVNRKLYFWGVAYAVTGNCKGSGKAFYSTHYGHMPWLAEAVQKMRLL